MSKSFWYKMMVAFSSVFWLVLLFYGYTNVRITDDYVIMSESPLVKLPLILFIGIMYRLIGFIGTVGIFPFYYWYLLQTKQKEKLQEIKLPKIRIFLSIAMWLSFALLNAILGDGSDLPFLVKNKVLIFICNIPIAIFILAALKICDYLGIFILSPIFFITRLFFQKTPVKS
jgi:hypothetical protein